MKEQSFSVKCNLSHIAPVFPVLRCSSAVTDPQTHPFSHIVLPSRFPKGRKFWRHVEAVYWARDIFFNFPFSSFFPLVTQCTPLISYVEVVLAFLSRKLNSIFLIPCSLFLSGVRPLRRMKCDKSFRKRSKFRGSTALDIRKESPAIENRSSGFRSIRRPKREFNKFSLFFSYRSCVVYEQNVEIFPVFLKGI